MIHLKFLGHIRTSMGTEQMESPGRASASRTSSASCSLAAPPRPPTGSTKYNTLLVVNDEEVFSASAQEDRRLGDGDSVVLSAPFSHGG